MALTSPTEDNMGQHSKISQRIQAWHRQVAKYSDKVSPHTCVHGNGERDVCRHCEDAEVRTTPSTHCPHDRPWGDDCPGCKRAGGIRKQRLRQYGDAFEVWLNN
jgi:hypothetical protein